jgi:aminoglycoside phosphotransferase (APT) family kinase protein
VRPNASRSRSAGLDLDGTSGIGTILWRISDQSDDLAFTPATGSRLHWEDLPAALRNALEQRLGSPVVEAVTQPGGFSPGLAARLRLASSERVFVKAVGPAPNPDSPTMHRREAIIAAALPVSVPTPRFLWSYDDGDWVTLAFEDIDGRHPVVPWRREELQRVLRALANLVTALTPAPIETVTIAERLHDQFKGWRILAGATGDSRMDLPGWARRHLDALAELESQWEQASKGSTLLHFDLRADNILITPDRVLFIDWPHAALGAGWLELAQILPSVAMQGGPKPWDLFDMHPLGREAAPEAVNAAVAALAGYFIQRSRLPAPPGLPTLRDFQRDQGIPALDWLRRRTGWP